MTYSILISKDTNEAICVEQSNGILYSVDRWSITNDVLFDNIIQTCESLKCNYTQVESWVENKKRKTSSLL